MTIATCDSQPVVEQSEMTVKNLENFQPLFLVFIGALRPMDSLAPVIIAVDGDFLFKLHTRLLQVYWKNAYIRGTFCRHLADVQRYLFRYKIFQSI